MNIELTHEKSQPSVAIRRPNITMDNIAITAQELMKVFNYLAQKNVPIAGAPYLAYSNSNADFTQFDIELGIPVANEIEVDGEFFMSKTCDGKALSTIHKGAYKDTEAAYTALMDYMAKNSLTSTGVYYDYYINNPADTPESELLTRIVFPIK